MLKRSLAWWIAFIIAGAAGGISGLVVQAIDSFLLGVVLFFLSIYLPMLAFMRFQRRTKATLDSIQRGEICERCGYHLIRNLQSKCPECGIETA